MKSMTFAEFFGMPPGTIFGQATGLPHQDSEGLYVKGESFPEVNPRDDDSDEEFEEGGFEMLHALMGEDGFDEEYWFVSAASLEDDHRFLVYEPDDLDRLAGLIGWGVGHGEDGQ